MRNYTALYLGWEGAGETPIVGLRSCSLINLFHSEIHLSLSLKCLLMHQLTQTRPARVRPQHKRSGHQRGVLKPDPEPGLAGSRGNWRRRQRSQFWVSCLLCFQPTHPVWLQGAALAFCTSPHPKQSVPGDMLVCISQVSALLGWGVAICGHQTACPWLGRAVLKDQKDGPKWAGFKTEQAELQAPLICQDSGLLLFRSMFPEKPIAPG